MTSPILYGTIIVDRRGVRITSTGYVADYDCHQNHSGNTSYVHSGGEYYQCQGCGQFISAPTIRARQANAKAPAGRS